MKRFITVFCLLILLFGFQNEVFAQQSNSIKTSTPPNPFQILTKGTSENNYLAPLLELQQREGEYLAFLPMRELYFELLTQAYLYVGNYSGADAAAEKLYENVSFRVKARKKNAEDLKQSPLKGFAPRSALQVISAAGEKHQVIIINEEHRAPVYRALTHQLLSRLYSKGFRYFTAETLTIKDPYLMKRGYPTQKSGFYTADPIYGDLVRQVIKLGFKVVHYEHETDCKSDNSNVCQDERERGQAQNLYDRILRADPKAKILVHVGRTHAAKTYYEGHYGLMAWHFQKITSIEPLTGLYAITSALRQSALYYDSLENWQVPELPELSKGFKKKTRRERLVSEKELSAVIVELMKPPTGKQTNAHYFHRVRLAHQIKFQYWTGLRRKEIASLKFSQFDAAQQALLNVRRWKTDTVTKFFPISKRAVEIIETRRDLQKGIDYIFTPDGLPIESNYRTLKNICI